MVFSKDYITMNEKMSAVLGNLANASLSDTTPEGLVLPVLPLVII